MNDTGYSFSYQKYFVAFLDVLGFKGLVLNSKSSNKLKIQQYFGNALNQIESLRSIESKKEIKSLIISDSVILSIPFADNHEENIKNLRSLCVAIGIFQYKMARINVWMRGAISNGDAFFDSTKHIVIGPAYIRSFELEQNFASYPRVIIDSRIINELGFSDAKSLIETINESNNGGLRYRNWLSPNIIFSWQYDTMLKHDLSLFIDYLSPLFFDIKTTRESIIKNLKDNIYRMEFYPKYRWIVDYLLSDYWILKEHLKMELSEQLFQELQKL